MTEAEVLEGMLNLLNGPDRWCKDLLHDEENDSYCLMGALHHVMTGTCRWPQFRYKSADSQNFVYQNVIKLLANEVGEDREWSIVCFNNAQSTTYEDVRLVIKKALGMVE